MHYFRVFPCKLDLGTSLGVKVCLCLYVTHGQLVLTTLIGI